MNYSDFDSKYNKRVKGKIKECSIIDESGVVYAQGTISELEKWWDKYTTPIWENGNCDGCEIDGKKVMMTNISESLFKRIEPHLKFILIG